MINWSTRVFSNVRLLLDSLNMYKNSYFCTYVNNKHTAILFTRDETLNTKGKACFSWDDLNSSIVPTIPPFSSSNAQKLLFCLQSSAFASCRKTSSKWVLIQGGGGYKHGKVTWQKESWSQEGGLSFMPGSRWCSLESGAPNFHQSPSPWRLSWSPCTGRWTTRPRWMVSLLLHRNPPDCRHCPIASSLPP